MATRFTPWIENAVSSGQGQNIEDQSTFSEDSQRQNGYASGQTISAIRLNTILHQLSLITTALMDQFCGDSTVDVESSLSQVKTALANGLPAKVSLDEAVATLNDILDGYAIVPKATESLESNSLSSKNVGSDTRIIYIDANGQPVASNGSIANDGKSLMYLYGGTLMKSSQTVGNDARPVYLNNGVLAQCEQSFLFPYITSDDLFFGYDELGNVKPWTALLTTSVGSPPSSITPSTLQMSTFYNAITTFLSSIFSSLIFSSTIPFTMPWYKSADFKDISLLSGTLSFGKQKAALADWYYDYYVLKLKDSKEPLEITITFTKTPAIGSDPAFTTFNFQRMKFNLSSSTTTCAYITDTDITSSSAKTVNGKQLSWTSV